MEGVGELGGDLQNLGQGLMRKVAIERLINIIKRHAASQAFGDQRDGQPSAANCQLPAKKSGGSATIH